MLTQASEQVNSPINGRCYVFVKEKSLMAFFPWLVPFLLALERLLMEHITYLVQIASLDHLVYSDLFMTSLFPLDCINLIFRLFFHCLNSDLYLFMGTEK